MTAFTEMEIAVLHAIFAETPALAPRLERQLAAATVKERENTGNGFFTNIDVCNDAPTISCQRILGKETHARLAGLDYGLGFILFLENGRLDLLEGYSWGGEDISSMDLSTPNFEIYNEPIQHFN